MLKVIGVITIYIHLSERDIVNIAIYNTDTWVRVTLVCMAMCTEAVQRDGGLRSRAGAHRAPAGAACTAARAARARARARLVALRRARAPAAPHLYDTTPTYHWRCCYSISSLLNDFILCCLYNMFGAKRTESLFNFQFHFWLRIEAYLKTVFTNHSKDDLY